MEAAKVVVQASKGETGDAVVVAEKMEVMKFVTSFMSEWSIMKIFTKLRTVISEYKTRLNEMRTTKSGLTEDVIVDMMKAANDEVRDQDTWYYNISLDEIQSILVLVESLLTELILLGNNDTAKLHVKLNQYFTEILTCEHRLSFSPYDGKIQASRSK